MGTEVTLGPGRYDKLCSLVRTRARALGVAVIIIDGKDGDGFSVQAPLHLTLLLPKMLREMADSIERDMNQ